MVIKILLVIIIVMLVLNFGLPNKIKEFLKQKILNSINKINIYFREWNKNIVKNILIKINKALITIKNKLNTTENEEYIQKSLSPKLVSDEELKKIKPYLDRLDEGIRMRDVNNIALMGSYGAGKSTILKNFEDLNPNYKILSLSLGSYSKESFEVKKDKDGNSVTDINEMLENSLVKQMIYREKKSDLPFSRFKKISNVSLRVRLFYLVLFVCITISVTYLKNYFKFSDILKTSLNTIVKSNTLDLLFIGLFFLSFILIFMSFFKELLKQFKLSKLSVGNIAIENSENSTSYFNRYLDEILYYFEINNFDVVVIEDVDRFNDARVFEHLKELNSLLNNSKQINRSITFIYAVKENISQILQNDTEKIEESEIRTKFFELIIPIIPIIDTFNSREYLVPLMYRYICIKKNDKEEVIKDIKFENFLKEISLFISDLRLLNNIVNEFSVYYDLHNTLEGYISKKKLFAIIVLKNLYPTSYADFQKSRGYIYELLNKQENFEEIQSSNLNKLNDMKVEQKKLSDLKRVDKIKEVKNIIFDLGIPSNAYIDLESERHYLKDLDETMIDKFINSNEEKLSFYSGYGGWYYLEVEKLKGFIGNYDSKTMDKIDKDIQKEIHRLEQNISDFSKLSIKEKFEQYPELMGEKLSEKIALKNEEQLILYLISNGYLAEDYYNYISLFYKGSLTIEDKKYVLSLISGQVLNYDTRITNVVDVIKEIDIKDYKKPAILVVDIVTRIFDKSLLIINIKEKREIILLKVLELNDSMFSEFIECLLKKDKEVTMEFVVGLVEKNNVCFLQKTGERKDLVNKMINRILYSIDNIDSSTMSLEELLYFDSSEDCISFREYLENKNTLFFDIRGYIEYKKIMMDMHNNDIVFCEYNIKSLSTDEFEEFVYYNLYDFNIKMFYEILNYGTTNKNISYDEIKKSKLRSFKKDIDRNIERFVTNILIQLEELNETETSMIELLNFGEKDLSKESKIKLIKKSNIYVPELQSIKDVSLWNEILKNHKCKISWANLQVFFETEDLDYGILNDLFQDTSVIEQLNIDISEEESIDLEKIKNMLVELVDKRIIKASKENIKILKYTTYNAFSLDDEEIKLLLEFNLVEFSLEFFENISDSELRALLLVNKQSDFIENTDEIELSEKALHLLLKGWDIENIDQLIDVIFSGQYSIQLSYAEILKILLNREIVLKEEWLENVLNYQNMDDVEVIKNYLILMIKKEKIKEYQINNILDIMVKEELNSITFSEYKIIFECLRDTILFVRLLNLAFSSNRISEENLKILCKYLRKQETPYSNLYVGWAGKVEIEKNIMNAELRDNLFSLNLITEPKESEDTIIIYNRRKIK